MNINSKISDAIKKTRPIRNNADYEILSVDKEADFKRFEKLLGEAEQVIDEINMLLDELYEIRFPSDQTKNPVDIEKFKKETVPGDISHWGIWTYYPWSKKLVHFPPEEIWEEVRTARNKTLITAEEQSKFWNFNIGIAGLSVGQSSVIAITRSGGCKNMKLADFDTLSPTNLNRLDGNMSNCGVPKTTLIKQKVSELDPYYNLDIYDKGIAPENIDDFFAKGFKLDAVIDAIDNIPLKIALRLAAKKHGVPVLMATDSADGVILDIERYDLEGSKAIFGGRVEEDAVIKNKMDFIRAGLKIISPEFVTLPMNRAMMDVGSKIPTHPQLGSSAILSGAVMAYALKKLSLGIHFSSERTHIDLEQFFNPEVNSPEYKKQHALATENLKKMLGIITNEA